MELKSINKKEENHFYTYIYLKKIENIKLNIIKKNRKKFINEMLLMNRKKLDKNYELVVKQMQIAYDTKNNKAFEILHEMESQILEALVLKLK